MEPQNTMSSCCNSIASVSSNNNNKSDHGDSEKNQTTKPSHNEDENNNNNNSGESVMTATTSPSLSSNHVNLASAKESMRAMILEQKRRGETAQAQQEIKVKETQDQLEMEKKKLAAMKVELIETNLWLNLLDIKKQQQQQQQQSSSSSSPSCIDLTSTDEIVELFKRRLNESEASNSRKRKAENSSNVDDHETKAAFATSTAKLKKKKSLVLNELRGQINNENYFPVFESIVDPWMVSVSKGKKPNLDPLFFHYPSDNPGTAWFLHYFSSDDVFIKKVLQESKTKNILLMISDESNDFDKAKTKIPCYQSLLLKFNTLIL